MAALFGLNRVFFFFFFLFSSRKQRRLGAMSGPSSAANYLMLVILILLQCILYQRSSSIVSCHGLTRRQSGSSPGSPFDALFDPCPNQTKLQPCECRPFSHEVICGRGITEPSTLRYIFQDASRTVSRADGRPPEYSYSHLIFESSPLDKLGSRSFDPFSFIAITVRHHYYLSTFEPDAFFPSNQRTNTLKFDSNHKLGYISESVHSLFAAIRSFPHLEILLIHNCGLTFVPEGAFGGESALRRLSLLNNAIKTIHAGAFLRLPNLRYLSLAGNQLDHIEPNSIALTTKNCGPQFNYEKSYYFIDLSANQLGPTSLNATSISVDCAAELNLSNNSLTYLPEATFRPLFSQYVKILLMGNPMDCADCHLAWLLRGRWCPSHNSTLRYHSLLDSSCDSASLSQFMHNCAEVVKVRVENEKQEPEGAAALTESDGGLLQCPLQGPNSATVVPIGPTMMIVLVLVAFALL